ncbi:hypothetical protein CASFOL_003320 [Castilleja foliolosa]|uniref:Gamma-irradiation and mitomycin c induced 1 n=1 Tax=Castilleja foliolosa TaxID=1961234 RepID=A0ABD3EHA3_9LAMI
MSSKTPHKTTNKRPLEDSSSERPQKSPFGHVKTEDGLFNATKTFKFRILMPNGTTLELKISVLKTHMPIEEFIDVVKSEYETVVKQRISEQKKRRINWKYQDIHFTDAHSKEMRTKINFWTLLPNEWNILFLHDGSEEPDTYEGMWDLTPDTDLLKELPDDYTPETALADLIDNSLQALWSNEKGDVRLISVELHPDKISIFDSGPGMDGADGNLVKWGKMGASLHRSVRGQAIGGKPPYLMPFFGMFGYGGPVATMCLGRRAVVSSKTKFCDKVFTLHLEREELVKASSSENCWRAKGGTRNPSKDEKKNSPHGSFTKVEIFEPHKKKILDVKHIQCQLKDIYFPYIQFDDASGKTRRLIDFQVNGEYLAEIWGGEVATTNMHSCNGTEFVVQLHFRINQDPSSVHDHTQRVLPEANARLKCVYFPIVEGKESFDAIIDDLKSAGWEITESFESFSRVAVRRLGRLLPDTRWGLLPFMQPKQRVGEKAKLLKRCCSRVKCFIDTDSGFNPTPQKTDLAQHHPYTKAIKNFGNRAPGNENEVQIEITKDGKKLSLPQLEKLYAEWVSEMHDRYDDETYGGLDEPTIVIVSSRIKNIDTSSGVLRVHKKIQRRGICWETGQKIKVLKGACAGVHSSNLFATLEYIILEGLPGDTGGEAHLICRPLGLPENRGCQFLNDNGNKTIDPIDSMALPIRVIDSGKCVFADETEWKNKLDAHLQKLPSSINLLSHTDCQKLDIEGGLPRVVNVGDAPPENIVAVIRPKAYDSSSTPRSLNQKFIVKDKHEMSLQVKFRAGVKNNGKYENVYSTRLPPSSRKDLHGLYLFPLKLNRPQLFEKAGSYTFLFTVNELKDVRFEQEVQVQVSTDVGSWKIVSHNLDELYTIRVGSCLDPLSVVCYDKYDNCIPFTSVPKLNINLSSNSTVLGQVGSIKVDLTTDKSIMKIKDVVLNSNKLDGIRPDYEATLDVSTLNEAFSVTLPCRVLPGTPESIIAHPALLRKQLIPDQIIEKLKLEVFDKHGNHAKEDEDILLSVDGFSFLDGSSVVHGKSITCLKKVNADGFVDLSNTLKVSKGYGKDVSLSAIHEERVILKLTSKTDTRKLQSVQKVFKNCETGSQLENIVFEIINSKGKVDESINDDEKNGQYHTLTIKSNSFDIDGSVRYSFRRGRCTIRSIPLPQTQGTFSFSAIHSRFPELNLDLEVHVKEASRQVNHAFTVNNEDARNQVQSSTPNHVDIGNLVPSPRNSCKNIDIPPQSSLSKDLRDGQEDFSLEISQGYASPVGYSPMKTPKMKHAELFDVGNFKEIGDELAMLGLRIGDHQRKLHILTCSQSLLQRQISDLQASIDRDLPNVSSMCGQEWIHEQIKSRTQSSAALLCKLLQEEPVKSRTQGLIGVVALLGTTPTVELSRVLANFLGEDLMLATVYENYEAANDFEANTLHKLASTTGQSTSGGLALCLDDIRLSITVPNIGPDNLLLLKPPTLPGGDVPQGFVGYAINMIIIETRAKSGCGLRETLFYRLFGELQVYRDRECMMMAQSCIKDGAVSLDGGIVKGKGLVSLGQWEPRIIFPVENWAIDTQIPETLLSLKERKLELMEINRQLDEQSKAYEKDNEMLVIARDRYISHPERSSKNVSPSAPRSSQQYTH